MRMLYHNSQYSYWPQSDAREVIKGILESKFQLVSEISKNQFAGVSLGTLYAYESYPVKKGLIHLQKESTSVSLQKAHRLAWAEI